MLSLITALWAWHDGFSVVFSPLKAALLGLLILIGAFYRYVRREEAIYLFCNVALQLAISTPALCILSYLSAGLNYPLQDKHLLAADAFFFFDWLQWASWLNGWPIFAAILTLAYRLCGIQLIIIVLCLFMTGRTLHMQRFLITFLYSALVVVILAAIFPAVGAHLYYNTDMSPWPNLHPAAARLHEAALLGMRNHTMAVLALDNAEGIITFPSFHGALTVLAIYAAWPLRWLRLPFIILNILILISTPFDGGHYLSDILAGLAIAAQAIWLAQKLLPVKT